MKKRQITIEEYKKAGVNTIIINNARCQKDCIEKILTPFLVDKELFFGFYRIDSVNLTSKQQKEFENEIPKFFQKHGDMQKLSEYLAVAKINSNDCNYSFIPSVFDYYLETMLFAPSVDWGTFKQYHLNYQNHRFEDIILDDLGDILFGYFDSGDFMICYNPEKYNPEEVRTMTVETFLM